MTNVIILDGEKSSALSAVRSLGRAQMEVIVGARSSNTIAARSRFVTRRFVYADPVTDGNNWIKDFRSLLHTLPEPPIVLAFSRATTTLLAYHRTELESLIYFAWNEADALELVHNNAATYSEAKILGIPVVATLLLENEGEIKRRRDEFQFPVVVKARHSITRYDEGGVWYSPTFVHTLDELIQTFNEYKKHTGEPPVIQPFIRGEEYGVGVLCRAGEIIAETIHHRLRSKKPTGGVSVLRETLDREESELSREMSRITHKIAHTLQWNGPLFVEFKNDSDRKIPLLVSVQDYFWDSLPLAIQAGATLPLLYTQLMTDTLSAQSTITTHAGYRSRLFFGDIQHLAAVLLGVSAMRPYLYPTRRKALADFFRSYRRARFDVWQWTDPAPSLWQYLHWLQLKYRALQSLWQ